jgi:pimeloyl-ACP methyl ester carboxylesterase
VPRDLLSRRVLATLLTFVLISSCGGDGGEVTEVSSDTIASDTTDPTDAPSTTLEVGDTIPEATEYSTEAFATAEYSWNECGDGLECAYIDVPLDYSDPQSPLISLFMTRRPASDDSKRIGTLLLNPGGPGFGGSYLARQAENFLSPALLERFDLIGFDPRGTGQSLPAIDCIDDYDEYFAGGDITPDTDAERQESVDAAERFTEVCFEQSGDILPFVGTNNVARDMDMIRRSLGEEKISYFGFSYGSELGAVWATMFPNTVRAAVLDGATDPEADRLEGIIQQNAGFEASLATFLDQCSSDRSCPFHSDGDAEGAFDELMATIDENPIPTSTGRPDLTRGMAITGVARAMYNSSLWDNLAMALDDARSGDGRGLLDLFDAYFQRQSDGSYGNELEAFLNIICADEPTRISIEEADAEAALVNEAAPRFSAGTSGDYTCVFWPEAIDPRIAITGRGAGPIVVIGTTGDAATPLEGTRNMARVLEDGRLIVVDAEQHTGYTSSACARRVADAYLIDLDIPDEETDC